MIGAKYDLYNQLTFSYYMQFKAGIVSGLVFAAACFGMTASASSESLSIESTQESIGYGNCSSSDDFIECMNQIKLRRDPELRLREKMRNLSFKLSSIISLPESEKGRVEVSELLSDLSLLSNSDSLASTASNISQNLFQVAIDSWLNAKPYQYHQMYGYLYRCKKVVRNGIDEFNSLAGSDVIEYKTIMKAPVFGIEYCDKRVVEYYEKEKLRFISAILREASIHPAKLREWEEERERTIREKSRSNWEKYLDENPSLRIWAQANPKAALKQSQKFNQKRPLKDVDLPPTYIEASEALSQLSQLEDFGYEN